MKKVFTSVQRVVAVRRHGIIQQKRLVSSSGAGSRANMSSLPLAETGWEDPPSNDFPHSSSSSLVEEYRSSFEGTLEAIFEMNNLGKEACNFEHAVRSVTNIPSSKGACPSCGRSKSLDDLCGFCTLVPAEQKEQHS